jgi:hypothetical protein
MCDRERRLGQSTVAEVRSRGGSISIQKTAASSGTGNGDRGKVAAATRRGEELNL